MNLHTLRYRLALRSRDPSAKDRASGTLLRVTPHASAQIIDEMVERDLRKIDAEIEAEAADHSEDDYGS